MSQPATKVSILRGHMAADRWEKAISLAAKFPDLGDKETKAAITRAHGCITNPRFFAQIGTDCAAAIEQGKQALIDRYRLP